MPIRINLLSEAQAVDEMRRKDPVKRTVLIGTLLAALMLVWSGSLQMKAMLARGQVSRVESQLNSRSNEFRSVLEQEKQLATVDLKLRSLEQLANTRMLNGNMLNALQKSLIDDVQVVRMRAEQSYQFTAAVKPKTNNPAKIVPGKPATVTEKIVVTLDARDSGIVPGDQVNKYRGALAGHPYFQQYLATNEVRLASLSPPQQGPTGKPFVMFTLECRYPQVTR